MPTVDKTNIVLLATALAVTLVPKALTTNYVIAEDYAGLDTAIVQRLHAEGFTVRRQAEISRPPTFYATNGNCQVMVRHATAPGSFDRKYRQNAARIGMVRYRIGAERYDTPPLLRFWLADTVQTTALRLGFARGRPAAIAIAQSRDCSGNAVYTDDLMLYGGGKAE